MKPIIVFDSEKIDVLDFKAHLPVMTNTDPATKSWLEKSYTIRDVAPAFYATRQTLEKLLFEIRSGDVVLYNGEVDQFNKHVIAHPWCKGCGRRATHLKFTVGLRLSLFIMYRDVCGRIREDMITKDHIRPKSQGGPNHHANIQPLCAFCNHIKSDAPSNTKFVDWFRIYAQQKIKPLLGVKKSGYAFDEHYEKVFRDLLKIKQEICNRPDVQAIIDTARAAVDQQPHHASYRKKP